MNPTTQPCPSTTRCFVSNNITTASYHGFDHSASGLLSSSTKVDVVQRLSPALAAARAGLALRASAIARVAAVSAGALALADNAVGVRRIVLAAASLETAGNEGGLWFGHQLVLPLLNHVKGRGGCRRRKVLTDGLPTKVKPFASTAVSTAGLASAGMAVTPAAMARTMEMILNCILKDWGFGVLR